METNLCGNNTENSLKFSTERISFVYFILPSIFFLFFTSFASLFSSVPSLAFLSHPFKLRTT
jgi:hypothetical protein